jgi:23S rRNA (guanine745-N1)-methyltransferase
MLALTQEEAVLDAGCGEGFYLGSLAAQNRVTAAGMDISVPAIDAAAKRYPHCEWIVGNADRLVPYASGSFSVVMSITARMNSEEFRRVLHERGRMLIAIPAPDDLIELRGVGRERAARSVATFSKGFKLIQEKRATVTAELEADAIRDILTSIYRPMQSKMAEAMRVTFSLDLLLFEAI